MAADKPTNSQVNAASNQIGDAQKFPTANGDVDLKMFDDYGALASVIDEKAERRLVKKLDMFIIPFFCATYLITYIDKATLSYAAIFGLTKDVHLVGTQYTWLDLIFNFGYFVRRPSSPRIACVILIKAIRIPN